MGKAAPHRHCIIGAGFAGLPVAKKLKELGQDFDLLDRNDGVGGSWQSGIYPTANLISSKASTQFRDFPMPDWFPDFPSQALMQRYLADYAEAFGLPAHIELGTEVASVRPEHDGTDPRGWLVELSNGKSRRYRSVVIANGHFRKPRPVTHRGSFSGEILRPAGYRGPAVFAGKRVLVVGYGNTGCDVAVDAAATASAVDISMRGGTYIFPRLFMGIPITDLLDRLPLHFDWSDRLAARIVARLAVGDHRRYGLPRPDFRILDKMPVVQPELMNRLRTGRIGVRPDISSLRNGKVEFSDGSEGAYDLLFYAVGYDVDFPMLDPADRILEWSDGLPILYRNMIAPNARGLFFAGLGRARTGGGPLFEASGYLVARLAVLDAQSGESALALLARQERQGWRGLRLGLGQDLGPSRADMRPYGKGLWRRRIGLARHLLDKIGCPDAPSVRQRSSLPNPLVGAGNLSIAAADQ